MKLTMNVLLVYCMLLTGAVFSQTVDKSSISFAGGNLESSGIQITSILGETASGFAVSEDNSVFISSGFLPSLDLETLSAVAFISHDLVVFPNPFQDTIHLSTSLEDYLLKVYNLQGRLLFESNSSQLHAYTFENLTVGIYLLQVESQTNNIIFRKKIIKK